jgi:hypothetical protein
MYVFHETEVFVTVATFVSVVTIFASVIGITSFKILVSNTLYSYIR